MRWVAVVWGLFLVVGIAFAAPAFAQNWTVGAEVPIPSASKVEVGTNDSGKTSAQNVKIHGITGGMLDATTPFHVGFGLESYTMQLLPVPNANIILDFNVVMADVYVDIPVASWLFISPGTGWGKGSFKLASSGVSDFHAPEDVNLWQFLIGFGVNLPWHLQARLAYREMRGTVVNRERTSTTVNVDSEPIKQSVSTLGIGWSF